MTDFNHPIVGALEAAFPLWVERVRAEGLEAAMKDCPRISQLIAEKGDVLLFGSKKKGEAASIFNEFARAIAILSFFPGGLTVFGIHFESQVNDVEHGSETSDTHNR